MFCVAGASRVVLYQCEHCVETSRTVHRSPKREITNKVSCKLYGCWGGGGCCGGNCGDPVWGVDKLPRPLPRLQFTTTTNTTTTAITSILIVLHRYYPCHYHYHHHHYYYDDYYYYYYCYYYEFYFSPS